MIKLKNKTRRPGKMVTVNIPHEFGCDVDCVCAPTTLRLTEHNGATGAKGVREVERKLPPSLTLQAGEVSAEYPDRVKDAPEVRAAIDRGDLVVL